MHRYFFQGRQGRGKKYAIYSVKAALDKNSENINDECQVIVSTRIHKNVSPKPDPDPSNRSFQLNRRKAAFPVHLLFSGTACQRKL